MTIEYAVHAEFDSLDLASRWVEWLRKGHLQDVVRAGALTATLVRHEPTPETPLAFTARYTFADMAAYAKYDRVDSLPLRAEGVKKFPPSVGMRMRRSVSEVLERA